MPQVCPRIFTACITLAPLLRRRFVILITGILYYYVAASCIKITPSAVPCRHYAIKHINPAGYTLYYVIRVTYTHQVSWLVPWKHRSHLVHYSVHHILWLSNTNASYCISVKVCFYKLTGTIFPQFFVITSLNYPEKSFISTLIHLFRPARPLYSQVC